MVKKKNWISLFLHLVFSFALSAVFVNLPIYDLTVLSNDKDFFYNCITLSSIIGGFLFTGISILISALDKERIRRLWENNYLDNLYRSALSGIIINVISIVLAIFLLCNKISYIQEFLVKLELVLILVAVIFFFWCIRQLMFVISRLRN